MEEDKTATNQLNNKIKTMEVHTAHTEKGKCRREGQILPVCFAISSKLVAWCCISW
jgi:hypothetical protein